MNKPITIDIGKNQYKTFEKWNYDGMKYIITEFAITENCARCNRKAILDENGYCCRSCELGFTDYRFE